MTALQNSYLIDEEMQYEVSVMELWQDKGTEDMHEAISVAMGTLRYPNPNVPEEEIEEHLSEVWEEKWYEYV
tara:strand:- start:238 stop:453 length:216 start_codon:yes stop_codon:yes gene_type:complete